MRYDVANVSHQVYSTVCDFAVLVKRTCKPVKLERYYHLMVCCEPVKLERPDGML